MTAPAPPPGIVLTPHQRGEFADRQVGDLAARWLTGAEGQPRTVPASGGMADELPYWSDAVQQFAAYLSAGGASAATVRLRRYQLNRLARFVGGLSPWLLTTDHLIGFLGNPSWSPETRHAMRSSVRTFYAWAERTGRCELNPARGDALPKVKRPRAVPRPAPDEVVARALERAELAPARRRYTRSRGGGDDALMVMLARYAGLRRGEIARLHSRWIVGDTLRVLGKGGRVRLVPLHPTLAAALGPFREGYDDYVFPGKVDGHVSPGWVGKLLARHLGEWSGHTVRHRFGTSVRNVAGLLEAAELLGHEKLDTTRIYTEVAGEDLRAAVIAAGPG